MAGRKVVLAAAAAAVLLSALGLLAPRVVRSPAQVAADRAVPDLPPATAVVERRVLTGAVTLRGTVTAARRADVVAAPSPGTRAVVTALPVRRGDRVRSGDLLVEVSGRPVLVLAGRLPPYRDLVTGDRGPDVAQLQRALRVLGLPADGDGVWRDATAAGVRALYRRHGLRPPRRGLPAAEVVFLPGLPGRVSALHAELGGPGDGTLMTVSSGRVVVRGVLVPGDRALVRPGQPVAVRSEALDIELRGTVARVGEVDQDAAPPGAPLVVRLHGRADPRLDGRDVRLSVQAARTDGEVLVVPVSAVTAQADGGSVVRVLRADGTSDLVAVRLGLVAGGSAAVEPDDADALRAGDRVVVGVGAGAGSP